MRDNLENSDNDFKVLLPPTISKDQDITKALKNGTYVNRNIFFNPQTFEHSEIVFSVGKDGVKKTLGGDLPVKPQDVKGFTKQTTTYLILVLLRHKIKILIMILESGKHHLR